MLARISIIVSLLGLAPYAAAQCDSTPPRLFPAFTMHGAVPGEQFGLTCYVIHDTAQRPLLCINTGGSGYYVAVYSRYASPTDTAYKCCIPYTEAHECHVTGSTYPDYVVKSHGDSIFLIPGTSEGIWSNRRQFLWTGSLHAHIAVGRFDGSERDGIVVGNFSARGGGNPGVPGSITYWHGGDSLTTTPDTVVWGDPSALKNNYIYFGSTIGAVRMQGDSTASLFVLSGGDANSHFHEMNMFIGGPGFPSNRMRWTEGLSTRGWYYEDGVQFSATDNTRTNVQDFHAMAFIQSDTVWGAVRSGDRDFVYRAQLPFDTIPYMRWRPLDVPSRVCTPYLSGFGGPVVDVGDINGSGQPAIAVGAGGSFGGNGAVVIYLGGKSFDTLPDAYYAGVQGSHASQVVGGFDFNGDGLMDFAVPMPADDGVGGTNNPAGQVAFIAGTRTLRSIGVNAVGDPAVGIRPEDALELFPNPVRGERRVTLTLPSREWLGANARIVVYDQLGRIAGTAAARYFQETPGALAIDLPTLPTGLYTITVTNAAHTLAKQFLRME